MVYILWYWTNNKKNDNPLQDGVGETSSAATPATGITEVGSSYHVHQDHVSRGNDDLDSASQTNDHDHDSAPIGNVEEGVGNLILPSFRSFHLNMFAFLFNVRKTRSFLNISS